MQPFMSGLRRGACALVAVVVVWPLAAVAANPDISVIGDIRAEWSELTDRAELRLNEVEFAFVGPVNPYASAEAYIAVHDGNEFEIEEAKLILDRYFPGGFGLTVGQMLNLPQEQKEWQVNNPALRRRLPNGTTTSTRLS